MKKILLSCFVLIFCSCTPWKRIADLTVISSRNIDSKGDYKELARYADSETADIPKSMRHANERKSLEFAVEKTIASVSGGEYLRNVTIFQKGSQYKIIGDVWGRSDAAPTPDQILMQSENKKEIERDSLREARHADREKKNLEEKAAAEKQQKELAAKFTVGDKVAWRSFNAHLTGVIIGKNEKDAAVKYSDKYAKEKITNVYYKYLTIIEK